MSRTRLSKAFVCRYVSYFTRTQKGANDPAQGSYRVFEDEDVSISSLSSSCLYKCLGIAQWFDGVGEEGGEGMFLEGSGSPLRVWVDVRAGGFLP